MPRPKLTAVLFLGLLFAALAAPADACVCGMTYEGTHPCLLYRNAAAVFAGQVVDIGPDTPIKHGDQTLYTTRDVAVRFAVEEGFRGVAGETIDIYLTGTTCDFGLQKGERYFIYASRDAASQKLNVGSCSGSKTLNYAARDLAYARGRARGEKDPDIFGHVIRNVRQSATDYVRQEGIAGVKVTLESRDHRLEVFTDAEGRFEVAGLPPGTYSARAGLPDHLRLTYRTEKALEVGGGRCSGVAFIATSLGAITGRLIDGAGKPVADLQVTLLPVDASNQAIANEMNYDAYTASDGRYRFESLSPGRYLVAINPNGTPRAGGPAYRKTYYPDAADAAQATVIALAEGQEVKLDDFRLPPRLIQSRITGVVLWPDGRPARQAVVTLEFTDQKWREGYVQADDQGSFSLNGFEGFKYLVRAEVRERGGAMHAEPVEITAGKKAQPVTLTITRQGYDRD